MLVYEQTQNGTGIVETKIMVENYTNGATVVEFRCLSGTGQNWGYVAKIYAHNIKNPQGRNLANALINDPLPPNTTPAEIRENLKELGILRKGRY